MGFQKLGAGGQNSSHLPIYNPDVSISVRYRGDDAKYNVCGIKVRNLTQLTHGSRYSETSDEEPLEMQQNLVFNEGWYLTRVYESPIYSMVFAECGLSQAGDLSRELSS